MADKDITKQLQEKKTALEAEFEGHKKAVSKIDNLIAKLQNDKEGHREEMLRKQGAYKLITELLKEETATVKKAKDKKHGNTTNLQSKEG